MFIICNKCHRHIRHTESGCPFCGATRSEPSNRLGVGLAVALGVAATLGCSGEPNPEPVGTTGGMAVVAYGPPPGSGGSAQGGASSMGGSGHATGGMGLNAYGPPPGTGGSVQGGASSTGGSRPLIGGGVAAYAPPPALPANPSH
jgi:hypothetical protein